MQQKSGSRMTRYMILRRVLDLLRVYYLPVTIGFAKAPLLLRLFRCHLWKRYIGINKRFCVYE